MIVQSGAALCPQFQFFLGYASHFPQRSLSRCALTQDDVAECQGNAAGTFGFDAVDDVGFSGGDGVLPFVAGGAGEDDQAAVFEDDGFFLAGFGIGEFQDAR